MNKSTVLLYCSVAVLLAACGGGSDSPAPAPAATDAVPASASQSAAGMAAWMTDLAAAADSADAKEPLDVSTFSPPLSDDTEPEATR